MLELIPITLLLFFKVVGILTIAVVLPIVFIMFGVVWFIDSLDKAGEQEWKFTKKSKRLQNAIAR